MQMKSFTFALAMALGLFTASSAQAVVTLNFAANTGSELVFVGNGSQSTFSLTPNSHPQFTVTSASGGNGSGVGVTGSVMSAGGFIFTQAGIDTSIPGVETADLTGTGTLTLTGTGTTVTGTITGSDIRTIGSAGGTNTLTIVNLTGLSIVGAGGNADLTQFYNEASANGGIASLTFQFIPAMSLTDLTQSGTYRTSYSGTLTSAVPEPGTMAMAFLAAPLLGLGYYRHRRRSRD